LEKQVDQKLTQGARREPAWVAGGGSHRATAQRCSSVPLRSEGVLAEPTAVLEGWVSCGEHYGQSSRRPLCHLAGRFPPLTG
jgi:hypothetical protein